MHFLLNAGVTIIIIIDIAIIIIIIAAYWCDSSMQCINMHLLMLAHFRVCVCVSPV